MRRIKFYKTLALPASPDSDALYLVKSGGAVQFFVTDSNGVAFPIDNNDVLDIDELIKALTVENPTSSENISIFFTDSPVTINKLIGILRGSGSLTWSLRYGTDRSTAGTEVISGGLTTNNATTGQLITIFDNANIPINNFIWFTSSNSVGALDEFSITIIYTKNNV